MPLVCNFGRGLGEGWSKALPSQQWSGYLAVGKEKKRHLHYYFIASEGAPLTDPVTLWLNGGPGASSIAYGMATEVLTQANAPCVALHRALGQP